MRDGTERPANEEHFYVTEYVSVSMRVGRIRGPSGDSASS